MTLDRTRYLASIAMVGTILLLAACGRNSDEADLANLDNQIVSNQTDPALTSALQDQILVDPTLSQQSNRNAVRSADSPTQAQYPAGMRMSTGEPCTSKVEYAMGWANRLPAAFTVYPGGRVSEAAANNDPNCRLRVVSFDTGDAPHKVLAWYRGRASGSGYSAEQQARGGDQILAGTNESDGGAYFLIVTPKGGGSDVSLITNNGR